MELGPVITALDGFELTDADRRRLCHPLVGGLTLFAGNYADRAQLIRLCADIHALRTPRLLIAVDHEGGRVQRFREGFTELPPMRLIGRLWDQDRECARAAARAAGLVLAAELRGCGVDISFTPVLDVDHGASSIIGDRAFHSEPAAVAELAGSLLDGMQDAGMAGVGKHFPGHGFIAADSHLELPVDERGMEAIRHCDLVPFRTLAPRLAGIMPAHVLYPAVDPRPAGFSPHWLQSVLRRELGFAGAIISDDLGMQGAAGAGGMEARACAALQAGCDLVLACMAESADVLLEALQFTMPAVGRRRLMAMFGAGALEKNRVRAAEAPLQQARSTLARAFA
ncbi:MAG: beta-N-acetylhexosaminidase [Betaproteobacteria bacterium]|nr:MAG: beta-N-acetylhexosaminidase [Betaproteobacteria bacterium]